MPNDSRADARLTAECMSFCVAPRFIKTLRGLTRQPSRPGQTRAERTELSRRL